MKVRVLIVSAMLLAVTLFSSCLSSSIIINIDVDCAEFEAKSNTIGNEFEIEVNDKIRAKLCANPSTGFTWVYKMDDENGVMVLEKQEYVEPDTELVGASGTDVWTFKAVKEGTALITMEYSQDWEGGIKAERTYVLDITVEKDR
ncbi:MAG: protease inhibitor I42 family protein [Dehalococcoidales bacterium]|nr:MAG: protease inhibitor I42 family protein [Dehalococcoidales bacterium]